MVKIKAFSSIWMFRAKARILLRKWLYNDISLTNLGSIGCEKGGKESKKGKVVFTWGNH